MIFAQVENPAEKLMYLAGVDKARFRRPVVPGDQLVMSIEVVTARHGLIRVKAEARVDGQLCCEAELLCSIVDRKATG